MNANVRQMPSPKSVDPRLKPPARLSVRAKELWLASIEELDMDVVSLPMLETYCMATAMLEEARAMPQEQEDRWGFLKKTPAADRVVAQSAIQARAHRGLGLDQEGRGKSNEIE